MTDAREKRALATELHEHRYTTAEIAARLGVSTPTVAAWLRRPATFAARTCQLCGAPFTPTNGRQRFCTPAHQARHQRGTPLLRECRLCGKPFTPTNGRQRFCTPAHQQEHQRQHGAPRTAAGWRERVQQLEAEIAHARAHLEDREAA